MATSTLNQPCFYVTDEKNINKIRGHVASTSKTQTQPTVDVSSELKKGQAALAQFKSSLLKTCSPK